MRSFMMPDVRLPVPEGWRNADRQYAGALERARTAVGDPRTPERLGRYYSLDSVHSGSSFNRWEDDDPTRMTERDLLAVTLLDKTMPAAFVRSVLEDDGVISQVHRALSKLPVGLKLQDVDAETLTVMDDLYVLMRDLLPSTGSPYDSSWSVAAKLCARKRPDLYPVRDEVICRYLDVWPSRYQVDWQIFYVIMHDEHVTTPLRRAVQRAAEHPGTDVGDPEHLLRHLDVALWMHAPHQAD